MIVAELMTPNPVIVSPSDNLESAYKKIESQTGESAVIFRTPIADSFEELLHFFKIFVPQEMKVAGKPGAWTCIRLVDRSL
jgi:hypothetical protein